MKTALSVSIWAKAGLPESTNCGRNAKKNSVSLGLSTFTATAVQMMRNDPGAAVSPVVATSSESSRQVIHARYSR